MHFLPWLRREPISDEPEKALADATEKLEEAYIRWPTVMGIQIEVATERRKNHFSERWEREMRHRAGGSNTSDRR